MKLLKKLFHLILVGIFSFGLMNCAPPRPVHEPPPHPRKEVRPHKPGPNYIWISGHYVLRHGRWLWVSGHWEKRKPGHVWVEGHWVKRGGRWVWVPGHWKKK